MAADAAVLVALRRQSSFSHRSLDAGDATAAALSIDEVTLPCSDTSAARRPNSCLELAGPAAQVLLR